MRNLLLISLLAVTLLSGCTSDRAYNAVVEAGYWDVDLGKHPIFACGKDDWPLSSYYFTAKNPAGNSVDGIACCGLYLKGCTIRY